MGMNGKAKNETGTGIALGGTLAGVYAICGVAFWLAPGPLTALGNAMFHGLVVSARPLEAGTFAVGLIGWAAIGFAVGWLYAKLFNKCC